MAVGTSLLMNRLLYDISEEALERGRAERAHVASWGTPRRCETNAVGIDGDCLFCGAINGEECRGKQA